MAFASYTSRTVAVGGRFGVADVELAVTDSLQLASRARAVRPVNEIVFTFGLDRFNLLDRNADDSRSDCGLEFDAFCRDRFHGSVQRVAAGLYLIGRCASRDEHDGKSCGRERVRESRL
jgi:hypothetical protein